ncbi:MAG: chitosanase [Chthoniobacterales bacterium]
MRFHPLPLLAFVAFSHSAESAATRDTIERLTSIFENSTPVLQYTYVENIHDKRGYTFGFAGFTSGTYDGTMFLEEYNRLHPGNSLARFLPAFRKIDAGPHDDEGRNPSVAGLKDFPTAFRACGDDPLFRKAQEALVDRLYWNPSQRVAARAGAKLAITRGQFYDTCINFGQDGLEELVRKTTRALGGSPKNGADERRWLAKFLDLRMEVLRADPDWREAIDRVRVYQKLLADGNVRLALPIRVTCYGDKFVLK